MLVNCVTYHHGQKLADISLGEVRTHLRIDLHELAVAAMVLIDVYLVYRFKKAGWM